MTDAPTDARQADLTTTRAAWLAAAVGIPLYVVIGGAFTYLGAIVFRALAADDVENETLLGGPVVALALAFVLIAAVGVPLVSMTMGRYVALRSQDASERNAALAFGGMGAALSIVPFVLLVIGTGPRGPGALMAAIGVVAPCVVVPILTRLLLPRAVGSRRAASLALVAAVVGLLVLATWSFLVFGGSTLVG